VVGSREPDGRLKFLSAGSTAAILGNPLYSLVAAARLVAERGERLEAGHIVMAHIVMAGGATAAEALQAGNHVRLRIERLDLGSQPDRDRPTATSVPPMMSLKPGILCRSM
jgi:hypothetical protein